MQFYYNKNGLKNTPRVKKKTISSGFISIFLSILSSFFPEQTEYVDTFEKKKLFKVMLVKILFDLWQSYLTTKNVNINLIERVEFS